MKNYSEFKTIFKNRKINNKTLQKIISEISIEDLNSVEAKKIINDILSAKDKTTEDITLLLSKFNNVKIDYRSIHDYIISNNQDLYFNLSTDQIMIVLEKAALLTQNFGKVTIPMHILECNKKNKTSTCPQIKSFRSLKKLICLLKIFSMKH